MGLFDNAALFQGPQMSGSLGAGGGAGLGGSPSAFTSPGMDPRMLALLMAMGRGQQGQPQIGGAPQGGIGGMSGGPNMVGPTLGAPGSLGGGMMNPATALRPGIPSGPATMPMGSGVAPQSVGVGMQNNPLLQQLLANPQLLQQLIGGLR